MPELRPAVIDALTRALLRGDPERVMAEHERWGATAAELELAIELANFTRWQELQLEEVQP